MVLLFYIVYCKNVWGGDITERLRASLCIVTYNNKDNIEAALDSVFRQCLGTELTVYVSDNCSSDGTADIVENAKGLFGAQNVIDLDSCNDGKDGK